MNFAENEAIECKTEVADEVETVYAYNGSEEEGAIVVPSTSEYKEIMDNKNVRLVQIRFPSDAEGRSWLSLVQNT